MMKLATISSALALLVAPVVAQAQAADQVAVERHATLRQAATRESAVVDFPEIGKRLELRR